MKVHLTAPMARNCGVSAQVQRSATTRSGKCFFGINIDILVSNFLAQHWRHCA